MAVPVSIISGAAGAAAGPVVKIAGAHHPELANATAAYLEQALVWLAHVIVSPF